jgi:hypothetical protein
MLPESWETVKAVWRNDESMALDALLEKIIHEERTGKDSFLRKYLVCTKTKTK